MGAVVKALQQDQAEIARLQSALREIKYLANNDDRYLTNPGGLILALGSIADLALKSSADEQGVDKP